MQQETNTFLNQQTETAMAFEFTPAWKLTFSTEVPHYGNAFFPESLLELNRQGPLGYKFLNSAPEPLPTRVFLQAFKADRSAWPPLADLLHEEAPVPIELARPYLYKVGI